MARGRLITIEGLDGAGKTTLATGLEVELRERGVNVELLREPGGVPAAERIRDLVKDPELSIEPRAEALLYAAARAQLVKEAVEPRLKAGTWVLLDRFVDSSLAYQGIARGLGAGEVRDLSLLVTEHLLPDRTFLVLLDPEEAFARSGDHHDRIEREGVDFMRRVDDAYRSLAQAEPERIVALDGAQPADEIAKEVREHVRALL